MKHMRDSKSTEARLWLKQVVLPISAIVLAISPEAREGARNAIVKVGDKIKSKFRK